MIPRLDIPSEIQNFKVPFGPIGKEVYERTYSHDLSDGTKETWPHTVVRVVDGNLGLVDKKFIEPGEREKLIDLILHFGALPAGRHLNASGLPGRQFISNCHVSGWDSADPAIHFTFLFDQLMQGGGVGSNYSNRYLETLPPIQNTVSCHIVCRDDHPDLHEFQELVSTHCSTSEFQKIQVEDSREGWVVALAALYETAFDPKRVPAIVFDIGQIRPRGSPLKTSGGIACGPGPLVKMLLNVSRILNACYGRKMTSLDAMALDHASADCVVAGGKRRSSRMSVKSWKDEDILRFIDCKLIDGSHWTTNISVEVDDEFFTAYEYGDPHARKVAHEAVIGMRLNGEPGFWNRSLSQVGERSPEEMYSPNPCGEIAMTMWESCILGHVNLEYFANRPDSEVEEAFRLMARYLVRATNSDMPQARQKEAVSHNRRIGVGFFGYHAWLALRGIKYSESASNPEVSSFFSKMKNVVTSSATVYASQMGIPAPVKFTTVAPTGSIAALPGATTGCQAILFKRYKRLVRYSNMDKILDVKRAEGYEVKTSKNEQDTSYVVYWCEDPLVTKMKNYGFDPEALLENQEDISFQKSLDVQSMLQKTWADNAISYTINLRRNAMLSEEEMEASLVESLKTLKGTTIFPEFSREDAPYQSVSLEQWIAHSGPKQVSFIEDECKGACPVK